MSDILLKRFQPLHLKIEGVGPFRGAFELPLTGPRDAPANFFLLVSKNGFGKTTVLETIYGLVDLLSVVWRPFQSSFGHFDHLHPDLGKNGGKAQLDIRLELEGGQKSSAVVLSLCVGTQSPLRTITPSLLDLAQADTWVPAVFPLHPSQQGSGYSCSRPEILEALRLGAIATATNFHTFFIPTGEELHLPTALYFPADRRIVSPRDGTRAATRPDQLSYGAAHKFLTDGETWETSLDGLLVWYEWLNNGLFEQTRDMVNRLLFSDGKKKLLEVDRLAMGAVVEVEHEDGSKYHHGLDLLSHGERSLMHLLVRSAYHRSGSTILLLDEMETHLHPKWQHRLMRMLKDWIREWPDLTVIATTHQPELIEAFAHQREEEDLVKGGYIIDADDL